MERDIKKLVLGDCEVTDAGTQIIADIAKVNDTIVELDLLKNTKSSKKYKITIDGSTEKGEKAKTTINNVMYYHDEVTHPDDVYEECVVQLKYGKSSSKMKRIQKYYKVKIYIPGEFSAKTERCNYWREIR